MEFVLLFYIIIKTLDQPNLGNWTCDFLVIRIEHTGKVICDNK